MINMKKRSDTHYITPFNYYELGIGWISYNPHWIEEGYGIA
jgi:hypothetical protein